jgi:branched-chain amino acid transport system ATP-binding protein
MMAGREITSWPPERRASHGLSRTFQNVRPFSSLDVFSNVELAVRASGAKKRDAKATTWQILDRFGLDSTPDQHAGTLPHGQQRLLGVARALAMNPDILLLDEPCAGLNDVESDALVQALRAIRSDYGLGILVIEHDMRFIMGLCDRIQVLDYGRTIAEGSPAQIRRNDDVIRAYLGTGTLASA